MQQQMQQGGDKASPKCALSTSREECIRKLQKESEGLEQEDDSDRLEASVRALIETNKEIWQRVVTRKVKRTQNSSSGGESELIFYRFGYFTVRVNSQSTQVYRRGCWEAGSSLLFFTTMELETRKFSRFPSVPRVLSDIFLIGTNEEDDLMDYGAYMPRVSLLREEISNPFLVILKEHLKKIQVALGEIECWILEASHALSFLNEIFHPQNLAVRPLSMAPSTASMHQCVDSSESAICVRCFHTRNSHIRCRCPKDPNQFGAYLAPQQQQNIKSAVLCSRWAGQVTVTFKICSERERDRLKKFIQYVNAEEADAPPKEAPPAPAPQYFDEYYHAYDSDMS